MKNQTQISFSTAAIIAGISIVVMTISAVVSTDLTIGRLVVDDNPPATYYAIKENLMLFRTGVFSWIMVLICDLIIAWSMYIYLKPINKDVSLITAWTRVLYTSILGTAIASLIQLNLLQQQFINGSDFSLEYFISETWFYYNSFHVIWSMGLLIFGLHILLLGYLSLKSWYLPKWMAIFLILGGIGYLCIHILKLLAPSNKEIIQMLEWIFILPMLTEVVLGFWLLWRGKSITLTDRLQ
ncbi:DUF4386 domain-containing protein [Flavobacteriaceae bacterium M23B6Z8]